MENHGKSPFLIGKSKISTGHVFNAEALGRCGRHVLVQPSSSARDRLSGWDRERLYFDGNGWDKLSIWVNYNELTASSLEIIVSKRDHPQMALIQVSELL